MDKGDPAWKLAAAVTASLSGDADDLEEVFKDLKPTTTTIARAYALCLTKQPFAGAEANRLILGARLQVALMEEHIAAQKRMGFTINALTWALVALTLALTIFGVVDLYQKIPEARMCHSRISIVIWVVATVLLVVYHIARGTIAYRAMFEQQRKEQQRATPPPIERYPESWQRIFVVYLQDAMLHACATIFGSLCLFGAAKIAFSTSELTGLSAESAVLMVSLGLLGIAGISGQLAQILASGQIPFLSEKSSKS